MKVRKGLPLGMGKMMMIDSIISHRYSSPVIRILIFIRCGSSVHGVEGLPHNSPGLPVIRNQGKTILRRELVISNSEMLHSQLGLNEIYERKGMIASPCISLFPFLTLDDHAKLFLARRKPFPGFRQKDTFSLFFMVVSRG